MTTKERIKVVHIGTILGRKIITADGNVIGHVADIELTPAPEFQVIALFYGRRGWYHRLHLVNPFGSRKHRKPDRVPWDAVERLEESAIRLKPGVNVRDWVPLE